MQKLNRGQFLGSLAALGAVALGLDACGGGGESDPGEGGSTAADGGGVGGGTTHGKGGGGGSVGPGGGDGHGGGSGGTCVQEINAQITCRTGHEMLVSAADIAAGAEKIYNIQGANETHGHEVTVTAAMFALLRKGETVEIMVPSEIQPHTITLACSGLDPHARDEEACV